MKKELKKRNKTSDKKENRGIRRIVDMMRVVGVKPEGGIAASVAVPGDLD